MAQHVLLLLPDLPAHARHDAALRDAGFGTSHVTSLDALPGTAQLLIADAALLDGAGTADGLLLFFILPPDEPPSLESADGQMPLESSPSAVVRTARRLARRAARRERLQLAARTHGVGTYEFDFATGRGMYTAEAKAIFGVPAHGEIPLGDDLLPLAMHPDDRARVREAFRTAVVPGGTGEVASEYRIRRADGAERRVEVRARIVFDGTGVERRASWAAGLLRDVTAEREAVERLAGAERFFRQAVEHAPVPVIAHALDDGEILAMSDVVVAALGWTREEVRDGVDWFMRVHAMPRAEAERALRGLLDGFSGSPPTPQEHDVHTRDGRTRRWRFEGSRALHLADGRPFAVSVASDITEHVAAERALLGSNALLDAIFSEAPVGLGFWDRELRFRRINTELAEMNGLAAEEHVGRTPAELLPGLTDLEALMARWRVLLETGEPFEVEITGSTPAAPDRTRFWKERFFPVRVGGQIVGLSGVVDEITEQREAERQLRESESRFRRFAENIEDVLWMSLPEDRRLLYVSPAFERIWGIPCEALHADYAVWTDAIHPEDRPRVLEAYERWTATFDGYDEQYRVLRPDGTMRWVRDRAFPVRDAAGRLLYAAGIAEDMTARRRAEERLVAEERRYHAIFEAAGTAMWEVDFTTVRDAVEALPPEARADVRGLVGRMPGELDRLLAGRRILDVNSAALRLHGARSRDVLAGRLLDLGAPAWREAMLRTLEALAAGETRVDFEATLADVEGRELDVVATVSISPPGERPVRVLFNLHDITARKRAEAVLREANQRKDEFLAMLAHELRNPLAPIRNAAEALRLSRSEEPVVKWARELIGRQVTHLAHIVDDLLDISRIMQGKAVLLREPVDLRAVLRSALETSRPLIDGRGHALELRLPAEPVVVDGDFVRLAQVTANLLTNAAKYTPTGGRITVALEALVGEAELQVTDTGDGLAPELLTQVFDLFTQAHRSLDRAQGGLGIGLTVVKRLVELHGGGVRATSRGPGHGSTFVVRLPLAAAALPDRAPEPALAAPPPDAARRRVLVVDDNPDAAESLAELLRLSGYEVRTAGDGASALRVAAAFLPEYCLLDVGLPGMDGYELAAAMRALPEAAHAMLVAVTGYGRDEDVRQALAAGFDHHMVKPIDLAALRALLERPRPPSTPNAVA